MKVFLNQKFVSSRHAKISVHDHGFLYGDGVFETLRAYRGKLFRLDQHLSRLEQSAKQIHLNLPRSILSIRALLYQTLEINHLKEALVRLTITRGTSPWGENPRKDQRPTIFILARDFRGKPRSLYHKGIKARIHPKRMVPPDKTLSRIKSISFLKNVLARIEARQFGAEEAILLNDKGYVTEGAFSNLFLVRGGHLLTPASRSGLLEGITRQAVLDVADSRDIPTKKALIHPKDLLEAEEVFFTNSSWEIMPATTIGETKIGTGKPGEMSKRLLAGFRELVKKECF